MATTGVRDLAQIISSAFTENVLLNILQQQSGFYCKNIQNIHFSPVCKKGEAYLSQVQRITIDATGDKGDGNEENVQVHLIVKSIPNSPTRVKTFRSFDFFKNEAGFYNTVWPLLDTFQKTKKMMKAYDSIPRCFAAIQNGKDDFIVMEDVGFKGYSTLSRTEALDLELTTHILRNFAKFHAISIAYREQHPKEFQKIKESIHTVYFNEKYKDWYINAFKKYCNVTKDAVEKELPSSYLEKFNLIISGDLFGRTCKLIHEESELSGLNHGDCWGPNFLLQGSGADRKMILIDFQIMRYTSVVVDILFFMYACVDTDIRNQHWDYLLQEYYNTFADTMTKLESTSNITLDSLKIDMKKYGLCGFAICMDAVTMCNLDDENVVDMDTIQGNEEIPLEEIWIIQPIKNSERRKRLADFVKHAIDSGLV